LLSPDTGGHFPFSLYLPVLSSKRTRLIITHCSYFILRTMLFTNGLLAFFVAVFLIAGLVCYIYLRLFSRGPLPDVLPWVGVNDNGGFFSHARATLKSATNTRELLREGYYKVNSLQASEDIHIRQGADKSFFLVLKEGNSIHLAQHPHRPRSNSAIASDGMAAPTTRQRLGPERGQSAIPPSGLHNASS